MARAQRASREEWAARLTRLKESGLSLTAFAEQIGVKPKTLSWWRKKMVLGSEATKATRSSRRRETAAVPSLNFVEMTAAVEGGSVEIVLASVAVRVRAGFDTATLARVLEVLEARHR